MPTKTIATRIAELERCLQLQPEQSVRITIEADLRKLREQQDERPIERDTFDLREHNFYEQ